MSEILFRNTLNHFYANQDTNAYSYVERREAWQIFEKMGLPTAKSEQYKHIHNHLVGHLDYTHEFGKNGLIPIKSYFYAIDAYHLAIVDGIVSFKDSYLEGSEGCFSIKLDAEAISKQSFSLPQKSLEKHISDPFLAINNALYNQDIRITIHESTVVTKPLIIYSIGQYSEANFINPRIFIDAKEYSKAAIMISYHDEGSKCGFINSQNFINLDENAYLDLVTLQSSKQHKSTVLNNTICLQSQNSNFTSYTYSIGASIVRNNLTVELNGTNTEANLYGLAKPSDTGLIDNHTTVIHNAEYTHSNELYRNIIYDSATAIFNGEIYVCKDAQKTRAFQSNDSILLSDAATVHTKPQLEIFADDVKCSHGATVGQLNMEEIFYLRTRGISEDIARTLLIDAFVDVVVEKMSNNAVKQIVEYLLKKENLCK